MRIAPLALILAATFAGGCQTDSTFEACQEYVTARNDCIAEVEDVTPDEDFSSHRVDPSICDIYDGSVNSAAEDVFNCQANAWGGGECDNIEDITENESQDDEC